MLQKVVTDTNYAWNSEKKQANNDFLVKISDKAIEEIKNKLKNDKSEISKLEKEILNYKKILLEGKGVFVIDGNCFVEFSKNEMNEIYRIIGKILGTLYVQNIKREKFVNIQDEGKSMQTGGRYHQTKEGGSFHTDSPQWEKVPDFIGLCCINPAKKGGESRFVSVYDIHNKLLQENEEILESLYQHYHFDKRGEFEQGESPTVFEPIFSYSNNLLKCRYLRDYIDAGQEIQNKPLTQKEKESLDILDKIIHDESLAIIYDMKKFDMVFFNNTRVLHGRTSFEDFEEMDKKRLLIRTWIKDIQN